MTLKMSQALFLAAILAAPGTFAGSLQNSFSSTSRLRLDGIYKFRQDSEVIPTGVVLNGFHKDNYDTESTMSFSKNEAVAVQFLATGEIVLTPQLAASELGVVPEQIVLSEEQFAKSGLSFIEEGGYDVLTANYSTIAEDQFASLKGRARVRTHGWGNGGCVDYVKRRLGIYGHFGNGVGTAGALRSHGFHSVSCSNPPSGAVASWSGGRQGFGHTAIWNGSCWQSNTACADPGTGYRMVGCVAR